MRPPPLPKRTISEAWAARGHKDKELAERADALANVTIIRQVVRSTIVAQARCRQRFLEYLNIMIKERPQLLKDLECDTAEDIISPGAKPLPLGKSDLSNCWRVFLTMFM